MRVSGWKSWRYSPVRTCKERKLIRTRFFWGWEGERETYLVDDGRLKVDVDRARDVLARAGLGEEGAEAAVRVLLVGVLVDDATVGAEAVLEAVKLPAATRRRGNQRKGWEEGDRERN
jgi:hypothetical protein